MRIGQLARQLNINPKTIRYYEEIGLLSPPKRTDSGYRTYTEHDLERLAFILRAKTLKFSLEEIREVLALREQGEAPCPYVLSQIEAKIAEADRTIAQLQRVRSELTQLRNEAAVLPAERITAQGHICHLIERRF